MCMYACMRYYIIHGAISELTKRDIHKYINIVLSTLYASTLDLDFISKVRIQNHVADRIKKQGKSVSKFIRTICVKNGCI